MRILLLLFTITLLACGKEGDSSGVCTEAVPQDILSLQVGDDPIWYPSLETPHDGISAPDKQLCEDYYYFRCSEVRVTVDCFSRERFIDGNKPTPIVIEIRGL